MNDKQIRAATTFAAGWLDKISVGCLIVGIFQTEHVFGGFIGGMICFIWAISLKIWSAR